MEVKKMTLVSEKAEWVRKKAEAEMQLKRAEGDIQAKTKWGNALRTANENIARIENVLAIRPWTDEMQAEEMRHYQAIKSIEAKYKHFKPKI